MNPVLPKHRVSLPSLLLNEMDWDGLPENDNKFGRQSEREKRDYPEVRIPSQGFRVNGIKAETFTVAG